MIDINYFLSQALIHPIWQAKKGIGSFLTFDMGKKSLKKRFNGTEFARGDIHLWIYMCEWCIKLENRVLCHSDSSDAEIDETLKLFIGSCLEVVEKISGTELSFSFSNGLLIMLNNNAKVYEENDDFFILYFRDKNISYNQKNGFVEECSDQYK